MFTQQLALPFALTVLPPEPAVDPIVDLYPEADWFESALDPEFQLLGHEAEVWDRFTAIVRDGVPVREAIVAALRQLDR